MNADQRELHDALLRRFGKMKMDESTKRAVEAFVAEWMRARFEPPIPTCHAEVDPMRPSRLLIRWTE